MLSVYIVDDEKLIVDELVGFIRWEDYGFCVCGHSTDACIARREILQLKPNLVISDISMDEMDGFELLKSIKDGNITTAFCYLSAYDSFEYLSKAIKLGARRYLKKPIIKNELISLLSEIRQEILNEFRNNVSDLLSLETFEYNLTLKLILERYNIIPSNRPLRFLVVRNEGRSIPDFSQYCDYFFYLFSDNRKTVYIVAMNDILAIKKELEGFCCGLSRQFEGFEYSSKFLKHAIFASKSKFITDTPRFVTCGEEKGVTIVEEGINKCSNKDELKLEIKNLSSKIKLNNLEVNNIQGIYQQLIFNMNKFGVIRDSDIFMSRIAVNHYASLDDMIQDLLSCFEEEFVIAEQIVVINEVIKEVEENIGSKLSLGYFADKYNYNLSYFSQLFKKVRKCSFAEYVINLKLSKAKHYLEHTNYPMVEIAKAIGYDDYFQFSKIFKKHTGYTPTEYREIKK